MRHVTRQKPWASAIALGMASLLGGCGPAIEGDWDFDGSGYTPTPAPTPTPSPTASPTPTASYATFDELNGSRSFDAGCGNLFGEGGNTSTEGFGRYPTNPEALAHEYDAADESWRISGFARDDLNGPQYSYLFESSDLSPDSTTSARRYGFIDANGSPVVFSIRQPTLGMMGSEYVRETRLAAKPGTNKIDIHCVIGVPTEEADNLPSGSFSYTNFAVAGTAIGGGTEYDLSESTATWSGSGTTLQYSLSINLVGRAVTQSGLASTRTDLGNYSTTFGWINPPSKAISGALFNAAGGSAGSYGGSFFGPEGIEVGFGFSGSGVEGGNGFQFGGTVVGRR